MPPQGAPTVPFRVETLFCSRLFEPPLTMIPEVQLVEAVTSLTVTPVLVRSWIPKFRNCWTKPSPRIVTLLRLLTRMPISEPVAEPEQPVCGSPRPVILNPLRSRVTPDVAMVMHGAPVTVQVTSPTSLLFSMMVSVAVIVPLISVARVIPAHRKSAASNELWAATDLRLLIDTISLSNVRRFRRPLQYGSGVYSPSQICRSARQAWTLKKAN